MEETFLTRHLHPEAVHLPLNRLFVRVVGWFAAVYDVDVLPTAALSPLGYARAWQTLELWRAEVALRTVDEAVVGHYAMADAIPEVGAQYSIHLPLAVGHKLRYLDGLHTLQQAVGALRLPRITKPVPFVHVQTSKTPHVVDVVEGVDPASVAVNGVEPDGAVLEFYERGIGARCVAAGEEYRA